MSGARAAGRFARAAAASWFALICGASGLSAHPHVWIAVTCEVILDEAGDIVGLTEAWRFDEMYSAFATFGLDKNRDGVFSREELAGLANTILEGAGAQDHFTYLSRRDDHVRLKAPRDARAEFQTGGGLTLHFRADLEKPLPLGAEPVRIEVYDRDLYADFKFPKTGYARLVPARPGCRVDLETPARQAPAGFKSAEDALINGPLVLLTNAVTVRC